MQVVVEKPERPVSVSHGEIQLLHNISGNNRFYRCQDTDPSDGLTLLSLRDPRFSMCPQHVRTQHDAQPHTTSCVSDTTQNITADNNGEVCKRWGLSPDLLRTSWHTVTELGRCKMCGAV